MNMIKQAILGTALTIASTGAFASNINVGGVIWDPEAGSDFVADANLFESFVAGVGGSVVGYGEINQVNGTNQNQFCPSCELTYSFSYQLLSASHQGVVFDGTNTLLGTVLQTWNSGTSSVDTTLTGAIVNLGAGDLTAAFAALNSTNFDFTFGNGLVNFYVDSTPDFDANAPTLASAVDGDLFLSLVNNGLLTGIAANLFDQALINGQGSGFLDVVGGLAKSNFDTNAFRDGSDAEFTSSFHINVAAQEAGFPLGGTSHMTSQSIPEPASLALIGAGLLGMSRISRRKSA